jgi:hypothetical protein
MTLSAERKAQSAKQKTYNWTIFSICTLCAMPYAMFHAGQNTTSRVNAAGSHHKWFSVQ